MTAATWPWFALVVAALAVAAVVDTYRNERGRNER